MCQFRPTLYAGAILFHDPHSHPRCLLVLELPVVGGDGVVIRILLSDDLCDQVWFDGLSGNDCVIRGPVDLLAAAENPFHVEVNPCVPVLATARLTKLRERWEDCEVVVRSTLVLPVRPSIPRSLLP